MARLCVGGSHRYWFPDTTEKKSPQFHNLIFIRFFSKIHTTLTQTGCEIFGPPFFELSAIASRGDLNLKWRSAMIRRTNFLSRYWVLDSVEVTVHQGCIETLELWTFFIPRKSICWENWSRTEPLWNLLITFHLNWWLHPGPALLKYWTMSTSDRIIGRIWRRGYICF